MKNLILAVLLLMSAIAGVTYPQAAAQSNQAFPQKIYYASDYGTWQVQGQTPNTFQFSPSSLCVIPQPAGGNFDAFNVNAPVYIQDAVSGNSEVLTPHFVIINATLCNVALTTTHNHYSFALMSGTGGLQEVLNQIAAGIPYPTQVVLDRNWYTALGGIPGQVASAVIGSVKGEASAVLVDNTTAPETFYKWNGSAYVAVAPAGSSIPSTNLALCGNNALGVARACGVGSDYISGNRTPTGDQTIAQSGQLHLNNITVYNGALIDKLTAGIVNNVFYVDGVSAAGIGQAPVVWAASTFYPQCQEVSRSGGNYLAIPQNGDSVTTPGTNSKIWYPITNGSIPTQLDCAYYVAAASIVSGTGTVANGAGASVILGTASNYYTNIGITGPTVTSAGQPTVNIFGQGRTVTTIKQGSAKGDGFPTLYQPPATTPYAFASFKWEGFTVDSSFVAPAVMGIYGAQQFTLKDLYLLSATDGSDHYLELGKYSDTPHGWTYEPDIENVDLGAGAGFGRGAIIATTVSGGVPSSTVTAGGSGFTSADTQVILAGTSNFGRPCSSMGTTTATIVGGAITAITSSATGCVDPVYTIVYGGANIAYGYKFSNVSDRGKIFGLTNGGIGWVAGLYASNIVNAITVENYHPISTLRGVQIFGGATFDHTQCDTIYQYCFDIETGAGVVNINYPTYEWNNPNMTGSRDLFFGLVSGTPGYSEPQAVNLYGEICANAAQQPGYAHFDSAAGVIDLSVGFDSASMPIYFHGSNLMYCNQLGLGNNSIAASPSLVGQHITMSNGTFGNQWDFNLGTAFINGGGQTLNLTQVNSSNTASLGKYAWNFTNPTASTNSNNYGSPQVGLFGTFYDGSVTQTFGINQQLTFAAGTNPLATYATTHAGSATPTAGFRYTWDGLIGAPSFKPNVYTVSGLPAASSLTAGTQVEVSDATTFTPGTCTGGGSDYMIAITNGTTWSCH